MRFFVSWVMVVGCGASSPVATDPQAPGPAATALRAGPRASSEWGCYSDQNPGGTPLQQIVDEVGPIGILTIDETCTITDTLVLPDRFTLRGDSWAGGGTLLIVDNKGITFDDGGDGEAHSVVENLEIQGLGTGSAFTIVDRNQIQLRNLIVRGFETALTADTAFSVEVEDCNFNSNVTGLALGTEANGWRIHGGICSQSTTCMDLHPNGDGNDTMILGVRMESNGTAISVGGLSTYIAFNRFEGNGEDVVSLPTAVGTALLANNTPAGTTSDLSELNLAGTTRLPLIDEQLRLSIAPNSTTTELFTGYIAETNRLRSLWLSNSATDDGVAVSPGYSAGYASWQVAMDAGITDEGSSVRFEYRAPNTEGAPQEVARIEPNGTVVASAFLTPSDARLKDAIVPVGDALGRIASLRGVSWRWRTGPAAQERAMGLIAQDVEAVFPEAVATQPNGVKAVSYDQLTAPIVEAIKQLSDQNASLTRDNADLRARLERLEAR